MTIPIPKANQFDTPIKDGAIPAEMVPEEFRKGYISHTNADLMDCSGEYLLD